MSDSSDDGRKSISVHSDLHSRVQEQRIVGVTASVKSALVVGVRLFCALSPLLNGEIVSGAVGEADVQEIRKALGGTLKEGKRVRAGIPCETHERIVGFRTLDGYSLPIQEIADRSVALWLNVAAGELVEKLENRALAEKASETIKAILAGGKDNDE